MTFKCEFQMQTSFMIGILSSIQSQRRSLLLLVGERLKRRVKYLKLAVKDLQWENIFFFPTKEYGRKKTKCREEL